MTSSRPSFVDATTGIYTLTGGGEREARALLAERFKGQLRFAPGEGAE